MSLRQLVLYVELVSSDKKVYITDHNAIFLSDTLTTCLSTCAPTVKVNPVTIPVPNVRGDVLEQVVRWLDQHRFLQMCYDDPEEPRDIEWMSTHITPDEFSPYPKTLRVDPIRGYMSDFNRRFVSGMPTAMLRGVMNAASYLMIPQLMDICGHEMANRLKGKRGLELRNALGLADG